MTLNWAGIAAVGLGAAVGAWVRWGLSIWLNDRHAWLPWGTVVANLVGGYAIGITLAWLALHADLSPQWRLFLVTGLLGGLTTFSTFSAEVVGLMQRGEAGPALAVAGLHLAGSLLLTWLGFATVKLFAVSA